MALNKENINSVYSLGKRSKMGKWEVGQWANQTLWSVDGSNKKICKFNQMTQWKFFAEVFEYPSKNGNLSQGDKVCATNGEGGTWYFIVELLRKDGGEFVYLVGI